MSIPGFATMIRTKPNPAQSVLFDSLRSISFPTTFSLGVENALDEEDE